ncbi:hypothetical protein JCM10207_000768 [Rhodosporidiobolus poonsookiae]
MDDIPVFPSYAFDLPPAPQLPPSSAVEAAPHSSAPSSPSSLAPKMKSCAVCRLRRVKCEREPGERDCIKCKERGLQCTVAAPKEKGSFRNGKRIRAAKEMYGVDENVTFSPPTSTPTADHRAFSSQASDSRALTCLQSGSANARLGALELKSSVLMDFLRSFMTYRSVSVFDGDLNFQLTFDQAGRRIEQLSDANQVLCGALLALGARCSDHPALVGCDAPRLADLSEATRNDVDLRPYGKMRTLAVRELTAQALELADGKGVLTNASTEAVGSLMLLESLLPVTEGGIKQGASYATAYKGHIRHILAGFAADPSTRTLNGSVMAWTAYVRDAMVSAHTGIAPTFSDDDAWLLRGEEGPPPSLPEQLLRPLDPNPEPNFWQLLNSSVHWITDLARAIPSALTGPRAVKAAHLDDTFVQQAIHKLFVALDAFPELARRAACMNSSAKTMMDALALARTIRLSTCHLCLLLHRILQDRLSRPPTARNHKWPALSSSIDDDYLLRLQALQREMSGVVFRAGREIVGVLRDVLGSGISLGTHGWLDNRSVELLFARLPIWAKAILDEPTSEHGGRAGFDYAMKLSDMGWVLRAIRSVGWASDHLATSYGWVEQEVVRVTAERDAFYAQLGRQHASLPSKASPLSIPAASPLPIPALDIFPGHPGAAPPPFGQIFGNPPPLLEPFTATSPPSHLPVPNLCPLDTLPGADLEFGELF